MAQFLDQIKESLLVFGSVKKQSAQAWPESSTMSNPFSLPHLTGVKSSACEAVSPVREVVGRLFHRVLRTERANPLWPPVHIATAIRALAGRKRIFTFLGDCLWLGARLHELVAEKVFGMHHMSCTNVLIPTPPQTRPTESNCFLIFGLKNSIPTPCSKEVMYY